MFSYLEENMLLSLEYMFYLTRELNEMVAWTVNIEDSLLDSTWWCYWILPHWYIKGK